VSIKAHLLLNPKAVFGQPPARQAALRIARLKHAGEWNIAPQAIPNLMDALTKPPLRFAVITNPVNLFPRDLKIVFYPLVYLHGRGAIKFSNEDLNALRNHLQTAGETLFADASCGSPAFDASFRQLVAELFPNNPLVPIPRDDIIYGTKVGFDLSKVQYTKAVGGRRDFPQLEGIKINDHWVVIYSKFGIGCVLDSNHDGACKGYERADAVRIGANLFIYSTLP
jgi:hypothetical protein